MVLILVALLLGITAMVPRFQVIGYGFLHKLGTVGRFHSSLPLDVAAFVLSDWKIPARSFDNAERRGRCDR